MDLVGYLMNALSDEERRAVEAELERDPDLRADLARWRKMLVAPLDSDFDIEPPLGMANRTLERVAESRASLSVTTGTASGPTVRLVDVAVAVGILLVASFLLLPGISSLRGDQGRLQCANQMRQVSVAINTYKTLENNALPAPTESPPLNHAGVFAMLLHAKELLPEARILVCPTSDSAIVLVPKLADYLAEPAGSIAQQLQKRHMAGSYGYNLGYWEGAEFRGLKDVDGGTVLLADRPPRLEDGERPGNSPNHGRHGQNVLFADGHVSWLRDHHLGEDDLFTSQSGRVEAGIDRDDICIGVSEAYAWPDDAD